MGDGDRLRALRILERADEGGRMYNDTCLERVYGPMLVALLDEPALLRRLMKERADA